MKRNMKDALLGGVCSGLADHFKIDVTLVRLAFILAFALFGVGPLAYIILWVITKSE